jgi:hypothetical protein
LSYLEATSVAPEGGSVGPTRQLTLSGGDRLAPGRRAPSCAGTVRAPRRRFRVELDRLTDRRVRWLQHGVAALSVRSLDEDEAVAIATAAGVNNVLRAGDYRVEADERDGDTLVIVRDGLAEFDLNGRYYRVHAGEMLRLPGGDAEGMRVSTAFADDGFDRWCSEREERIDRAVASRYVSADIVGYEDLDAYGSWDYAPGYGYVWYPSSVGPGWTPYAFGSWVWVGPWGWTWIDSSPWGYAPITTALGALSRPLVLGAWAADGRGSMRRRELAARRPLQTGDGRLPPPPPPRDAAACPEAARRHGHARRFRNARECRAANAAPAAGGREPREPRNGSAAPGTAVPGVTAPAATPTPSQPRSERPQNGRSESNEQRREREREPQKERPLQTREPAPALHSAPRPVAPQGPAAPAGRRAGPAQTVPTRPRSRSPRPRRADHAGTTTPVQVAPAPAPQQAPQQTPEPQPSPRRQHEDREPVERGSDPRR